MQISLTKKLYSAMGIKPIKNDTNVDPLFSWTANWTNTFGDSDEDMIVMINHATMFTVCIYGVKKNQFDCIDTIIKTAIRNTLLEININAEIVDEYIKLCGDITYITNNDRKITGTLNGKTRDACFVVGDAILSSTENIKFNDAMGSIISKDGIPIEKNSTVDFFPDEKMRDLLSKLTNKPIFKYTALEILVTLDLDIYKATRKLIVPANIKLTKLHKILQRVFNWRNYHLYDYTLLDNNTQKPIQRLVASEEDLDYDEDAILIGELTLADYFPEYKNIIYRYDFGDNWEHIISLVRVINDHNENSPYLVEAIGQTPPEDVGSTDGFIEFREIMLDPNHPEYADTKKLAGYWTVELNELHSRPGLV